MLGTSNFSFPTVFSTHLDNFLPFLSNLKLSSANSFGLKVLNLSSGNGLRGCTNIFYIISGYASEIFSSLSQLEYIDNHDRLGNMAKENETNIPGERIHNKHTFNFSQSNKILTCFILSTTLTKKLVWNIMGIGENAGKQHFLLFPQCFLLSLEKKIYF